MDTTTVFSGGLRIEIAPNGLGSWGGKIFDHATNKELWAFAGLRPGAWGPDGALAMAAAALSFGSYYSSDNRSDVPEWAPTPENADEIGSLASYTPDNFPTKGEDFFIPCPDGLDKEGYAGDLYLVFESEEAETLFWARWDEAGVEGWEEK